MIAVLQRVSGAKVSVLNKEISSIDKGLVILLGVMSTDGSKDVKYLVDKIINFRIFNDENDKMNLSVRDVNGQILVISQFTLCANWLKGRRPSFVDAADPQKGNELYEQFISEIENEKITVSSGQFGAMMEVSLVNDGPVTFVLDSKLKR